MNDTTIDPRELDKFSAMAREWWDPDGKFKPLHRFNPVRLAFIKEQVCQHFSRPSASASAFVDLRLLDIGCGGGLLAEPMARLGAQVVGVDPVAGNIAVAQLHAAGSALEIDYRCARAEDLAAVGERFDVILNMEVIEHVADARLYFKTCARLLAPGGIMIVSTLNRTIKSYALAIVGAEVLLRWLPRGTHDWNRFITLEEMRDMGAESSLMLKRETGVTFNPIKNAWGLSSDADVNYMMVFTAPRQERDPSKGT